MRETAFTRYPATRAAVTRIAGGARLVLALTLLMAMLIFPLPRTVHAATITVTTLTDENDHRCTDGDCSLRDAIETAAANDTITFGVSGATTLTLGVLTINKNLTVSGPGAARLTVSGNNVSRVFHITSGAVTISGVTITKGYDAGVDGGSIYNEGTLTVTDCTFTGNLADNDGSAIYSEGALTVRNSTFSGNTAGNDGGSISVAWGSSLTVTDSLFSGNQAGNNGGSISAAWTSSLTVTSSTFSNNQAGNNGGAIDGSAPLVVVNSVFSGNQAGNDGGGISAWDLTTVRDCTFTNNTAGNYGGGMYVRWYSAVMDSTFSGNQAGEGGGIGNGGVLVVSNATFSGNQAAEEGGGIGNNWSLAASNCTLSGNGADAGGGGIYSPPIFTATITNTIVANSAVGGNCLGTIASGGHNIDSGASCGWGATNGSRSNTNPLLLALANNGGDMATMALQPGSPAINQGANADCPPADQRGAARPEGAACDIGAYEYGATPTLTAIMPNSAVTGSPALTLTLAGANFIAGAAARWDGPPGVALATIFISPTQLLAQLPTSRLTAAGRHTVTVRNPGPGDGTSGARLFTIQSQKVHLPVIRRQ